MNHHTTSVPHLCTIAHKVHVMSDQQCNRLCLLLRLAMVTIDTLIGVRDSYFREYSEIDSIVCKVIFKQ